MKNIFKILLILIIPVKLFAQDTTVVKHQAELMAKAVAKGDYKTLVDHMYPRFVAMSGGKEKMMTTVSAGMGQLKAQGFVLESAVAGSPGKFYKAGKEIHCLIPEIVTVKTPGGRATLRSNLLAISGDHGKTWTFLDLNQSTIPKIPQLFPHFNPDLKIPQPTMMGGGQ
jgi:hypothetical protein